MIDTGNRDSGSWSPAHRPLRILHLANTLVDAGNGIIHVMVDLAVEQRRAGHEVAVGAPDGDFAGLLAAHGVRHIRIPQAGLHDAALAVVHLGVLVRRERLDILHGHMVSGALVARLAAIGTTARVVTHVHNSWQRHATLMRIGHRVIAVSEAVREEMIGRGIPGAKITTVMNGTLGSVRRARVTRQGNLTLAHPNIVTVAGMCLRKGIVDLLEALRLLQAHLPGLTLYLVGDGPDRRRFERIALELGIEDRAVFLGFRPDAADLMRQADMFVLASHADPNPLVIAEARAAGCAIVATAVGGIPEALDQGRAGLLVRPRDPLGLSEGVRTVLLDGSLRERLSRAALEGLERFHVQRMSADVLATYQEVLALRE